MTENWSESMNRNSLIEGGVNRLREDGQSDAPYQMEMQPISESSAAQKKKQRKNSGSASRSPKSTATNSINSDSGA